VNSAVGVVGREQTHEQKDRQIRQSLMVVLTPRKGTVAITNRVEGEALGRESRFSPSSRSRPFQQVGRFVVGWH